jgi:hypothetical protein
MTFISISDGPSRSTHEGVAARLGLAQNTPAGLLMHTAGELQRPGADRRCLGVRGGDAELLSDASVARARDRRNRSHAGHRAPRSAGIIRVRRATVIGEERDGAWSARGDCVRGGDGAGGRVAGGAGACGTAVQLLGDERHNHVRVRVHRWPADVERADCSAQRHFRRVRRAGRACEYFVGRRGWRGEGDARGDLGRLDRDRRWGSRWALWLRRVQRGGAGGASGPGAGRSGGGGGASDVRTGTCASTLSCGLAARALVGGGGGGWVEVGGFASGQGGGGGNPAGVAGASAQGGGGGGGGQRAGGSAGTGDTSLCGGAPAGGAGGVTSQDAGGAGGDGLDTGGPMGGEGGGGVGGGYWGGGGGGGSCPLDHSGAGGGGSSFGPAGATFTNAT